MAFGTPGCVGFGHGIGSRGLPSAPGQLVEGGKGKRNFFQNKYCDPNPTWVWHAIGSRSSAPETTSANVSTTTDSRTVDGNPANSRDPAFAYATSVFVEYTDGRVR